MTARRIQLLLAEDDPTLRAFLVELCKGLPLQCTGVASGAEALRKIASDSYDLIMTDIKLPGADGIEVLRKAREKFPHAPVILMTAFATVPMAVEAMKLGATEFLQKPFTAELAEAALRSALERVELHREIDALTRDAPAPRLIGLGAGLKELDSVIERVAASDANVVIFGESGSGKELIARELHHRSRRAQKRLVALHVSAIPETLIESELFGHDRGAFTGAVAMRRGLLELADGGTLFLDEIGDLSATIQVKLLRFVQERSFRRLGGNQEIEVDVRIISATHRSLTEEVAAGRFREDLFYRLNVVPLHVPPLRERRQDIPDLVRHFIDKFRGDSRCQVRDVSPAVLNAYQNYDWPGNVRELENVIARAVALSSGPVLERSYLDAAPATAHPIPPEGFSLADHLGQIERDAIIAALEMEKGVRARAAARLGIKRTTLLERMAKYGIS